MTKHTAHLVGIGRYLPQRIMTNKDFEKLVDTTDEWIVTRTGMRERRIAAPDECTSDMGFEAAKKALQQANIAAADVDLILFATLTPDYIFPSSACLVQHRLGAVKAAAMDVQAACSGYIYGLSIAKSFIESGLHKCVLLIASEKLSSIVDYQDRGTCVLFGDGASACVITAEPRGLKLGTPILGADGGQSTILLQKAGGSKYPASMESVQAREHFISMQGKEVYRHAVQRMEQAAMECLERENMKKEDLNFLVPHQANIRILESIARRCEISMDRVICVVEKYGNMSAASVGIGLEELLESGRVEAGHRIMLVAFGGGLTWGSLMVTAQEKWQTR